MFLALVINKRRLKFCRTHTKAMSGLLVNKIEWANRKKTEIIVNEIHIKNNIQTFNYWLCPFFNPLATAKKKKKCLKNLWNIF